MDITNNTRFIYSTAFNDICSPKFRNWCIHLLCRSGEGRFAYNGNTFHIIENDAAIITNSESVSAITASENLQVEILAMPQEFLNNQLPIGHYGIGGGISLFDNPIIPLSETDAKTLLTDMLNIRNRSADMEHTFYDRLLGSLALTMIYDLFHFHSKIYTSATATHRNLYVVKSLMALLDSGITKRQRSVSYYADKLNVSTKYLSDTVRRQTGRSVTYFIDRYTVPIIVEYLANQDLSITQISDDMNFSSVAYFSRYV